MVCISSGTDPRSRTPTVRAAQALSVMSASLFLPPFHAFSNEEFFPQSWKHSNPLLKKKNTLLSRHISEVALNMLWKETHIDVQEAHSSSDPPLKHEGGDDSQGGRLTRLQPSHQSLDPSALRLGETIFALLIAVLCVVLNSTIVSAAIPRITDDFHDLHSVG